MQIKSRGKYGYCSLCGKNCRLTFEHVPPKSSFNDRRVKKISFQELIDAAKESTVPKGKIQQKGRGDYYLCESCNNNTGAWYAGEYVKVSNGILNYLSSYGGTLSGQIHLKSNDPIYPQRVFKQIITMFCDISGNCLNDPDLKEYLLNKESIDFNKNKYRVFTFINLGNVSRHNGVGGIGNLKSKETVLLSEIIDSPLSFVLIINGSDEGYHRCGYEITNWATFSYNESILIDFSLPIKCINNLTPYQGFW